MRILSYQVLRGPNLFARERVIRLTLDRDALREWPSVAAAARPTRTLLDLLPGLDACRAVSPSPIARLRGGERVILGEMIAAAALELQAMAGWSHGHCAVRPAAETCEAIIGYQDEEVALRASELALRLVRHSLTPGTTALIGGPPSFDAAKACDEFLGFARARMLDQTTAALVREAERRDIPWFRLSPGARFVQFGHGHLQKRAHETVTSRSGVIAVWIASSKSLTNQVLGRLGIPVPRQQTVRTARDAVRAAEKIGYPVVVKPSGRGQARGVSVGMTDAKSVEAAFARAREHDATVVVESFIAGDDHRLLVVQGRLVAAAKRIPARVVGDGVKSIAALIDDENRDPRRGVGFTGLLNKIERDAELELVLTAAGRTLATVPAAGETVPLRRTANIHSGGTSIDVTALVHPDNRFMIERAAAGIGLDVIGIDYLTPDIGRSYKEVGGGICEVNQSPGLRPHWTAEGSPDVTRAVMDSLYPPGETGRIPIAAVTGTNGKTTTCRMVAHILRMTGRRVGLCTTDGVYVDGDQIVAGDSAGYHAARMILADPTVDAAVLEAARGGIIGRGLGFDWCNVGAVLSVTEDHLGHDGIDTLEQMAAVKRLVTDLARDCAVFNADDELSLRLSEGREARGVCLVTMQPDHAAVTDHLARGGRAVALDSASGEETIVFQQGATTTPVIATRRIPAAFDGKARYNVQNAMFAAAIAIGLGKTPSQVRDGLASFTCDFASTPGRTNLHEGLPFKVVVDYAHNPAAIDAITGFLRRLDASGRHLCVFGAPGDRNERHVANLARRLGGLFDHVICTEDDDLRGRQPMEMLHLVRDSLIAAGFEPSRLTSIPNSAQATRAGLEMARPGDVLLIIADESQRAWRQVVEFQPSSPAAPPADRERCAR